MKLNKKKKMKFPLNDRMKGNMTSRIKKKLNIGIKGHLKDI